MNTTKLVQPFKSYGQSKIEKGNKYAIAQNAWSTKTPRVPREALKITSPANGGEN